MISLASVLFRNPSSSSLAHGMRHRKKKQKDQGYRNILRRWCSAEKTRGPVFHSPEAAPRINFMPRTQHAWYPFINAALLELKFILWNHPERGQDHGVICVWMLTNSPEKSSRYPSIVVEPPNSSRSRTSFHEEIGIPALDTQLCYRAMYNSRTQT